MKKTSFIFIAFTFISMNSFAQDSAKEAWAKTGYDIEFLFAETDFKPSYCQTDFKAFSACVTALNFLASHLPDASSIEVDKDAEVKLSIVSKPIEAVVATDEVAESSVEEAVKEIEEFQASLEAVYNLEVPMDLEPLFLELYERAKLIEEDVAYVAGETFDVYLQNAYDPASGLLPLSLFYREPRVFFGAGMEVRATRTEPESDKIAAESGIVVLRVFKGSPASAAGLKRGDEILEVDGTVLASLTLQDAVDLITGLKDTEVVLTIKRFCSGEMEDVSVIRGPVTGKADILVDSYFVSYRDFNTDPKALECEGQEPEKDELQALYVPLKAFDPPNPEKPDELTLFQRFIELQIRDANNPNSLGMVLDLRDNGGGSLSQTLQMLDSLIQSDELLLSQHSVERGVLIGEREDVFATKRGHLSLGFRLISYDKPIVVLINGASASASEVFSGTIQDFKRGWVVGEKSFGKGSVQTVRPHRSADGAHIPETMIKTTTAIYSLNSGRSPQRVGITPDFWYSSAGEELFEEDHEISARSDSFNAVKGFKNVQWVQNRPDEKRDLSECVHSEDSLSQTYLRNMKDVEPSPVYSALPDYQDLLARDILLCSYITEAVKAVKASSGEEVVKNPDETGLEQ